MQWTRPGTLEGGVATKIIQPERVLERETSGTATTKLSSRRAEQNHALEHAVHRANDLEGRLLVVFGLTEVRPTSHNPRAT